MLVISQGLAFIGTIFILLQVLLFICVVCIVIAQISRRRRHLKKFKKELERRRAAHENGSLQRTGRHPEKPVTKGVMAGSRGWMEDE